MNCKVLRKTEVTQCLASLFLRMFLFNSVFTVLPIFRMLPCFRMVRRGPDNGNRPQLVNSAIPSQKKLQYELYPVCYPTVVSVICDLPSYSFYLPIYFDLCPCVCLCHLLPFLLCLTCFCMMCQLCLHHVLYITPLCYLFHISVCCGCRKVINSMCRTCQAAYPSNTQRCNTCWLYW